MRVVAFAVALVAMSASAQAEPITIQLVNQSYSTFVSSTDPFGANVNHSLAGSDPVHDVVSAASGLFAEAVAGPLSISAFTEASVMLASGAVATAKAIATSVIDFKATSSGVAHLSVRDGLYGNPSFGFLVFDLLNVTTGQVLLNDGWNTGNISQWQNFQNQFREGFSANPGVDVSFNSTDVYRLTLSAETNAQGDRTNVRMTVGGLETARMPEPRTFTLLTLGLVVQAARTKLRRRRSSRS